MKISHPLPAPKDCGHCNSKNIALIKNKFKSDKGKIHHCWQCFDCYAMVSCHTGTDIPMGYMTDREGRHLRKNLHLCFDTLWQNGHMTREEAYKWLAVKLGKTREEMHISWLSKPELRNAMVICKKELDAIERTKERRAIKAEAKRIENYAEHRKHVSRRIGNRSKFSRPRG